MAAPSILTRAGCWTRRAGRFASGQTKTPPPPPSTSFDRPLPAARSAKNTKSSPTHSFVQRNRQNLYAKPVLRLHFTHKKIPVGIVNFTRNIFTRYSTQNGAGEYTRRERRKGESGRRERQEPDFSIKTTALLLPDQALDFSRVVRFFSPIPPRGVVEWCLQ